MIGPVKELVRSLIGLAETRARLAANELEEQALRLVEIGAWVLFSMFFFGVAVVFAAILIVLLAWDANRILAAGLLAALFLATGVAGALVSRRLMRERPRMFAATLEELAKDRERLERDAASGG